MYYEVKSKISSTHLNLKAAHLYS